MAEDGKLDKLKEQYIDEILAIVPLSQAVFIVLLVLVSDNILKGNSSSVVSSLHSFGLKSSLGPDKGSFWEVGLLSICVAFGLALLNTFLIRNALERSLQKAGLGSSLINWQRDATLRIAGLTDTQKTVIQASFKTEIDSRLKKYKAKRISTETVASIASMAIYANGLMAWMVRKNGQALAISWNDVAFCLVAILMCISLHRASIRYAIAKILPLKVYIGVLTGELVFFEEISG